jgi:hypothetical protein
MILYFIVKHDTDDNNGNDYAIRKLEIKMLKETLVYLQRK